jgi:cytosine permease
VGSILAFLVVVPLMFVVGITLAQVAKTWDIVEIMLKLGWGVLALLVLLLAQWTSNDNNLYCSALGFAVVFKKLKKWQLTLISGVIGIILALVGIYDNLITFLSFLGILIPPMGGVIIADYFFFNGKYYKAAYQDKLRTVNILPLAAWIIASVVSLLTTYTPFSLTTVPSIDGLLIGFIIQFVGSKIMKKPIVDAG